MSWNTPLDLLSLSGIGINAAIMQIAFAKTGGNAIAVWQEAGLGANVVALAAATTNGGLSWQTPITLSDPGQNINSAQIAFGTGINAIAVWSSNAIEASRTTDGGATWQTPVILSPAGQNASDPQIAFGTGGNAIAVWQVSDGTNTLIQASKTLDSGATWQTPITLSQAGNNATSSQIAFGTGGNAIAIWLRSDGTNILVQASKTLDSGATWQTPITLSQAGNNAIFPQIVFGTGGNAIAIWQSSNGVTTSVLTSETFDGGATWQTPITLSQTGQSSSRPDIAFGTGGNAIAVWQGNDGVNTSIKESETFDGGATWQTPITLSQIGNDAFTPQIAFSSGNTTAVWQNLNVNFIIQASSSLFQPQPSEALSVSGKQDTINSLFQRDIVNALTWDSVPAAVFYNVYDSNNTLLFSGNQLSFFDHGRKKGTKYTYFVTFTDSLGEQSAPVTIVVP